MTEFPCQSLKRDGRVVAQFVHYVADEIRPDAFIVKFETLKFSQSVHLACIAGVGGSPLALLDDGWSVTVTAGTSPMPWDVPYAIKDGVAVVSKKTAHAR